MDERNSEEYHTLVKPTAVEIDDLEQTLLQMEPDLPIYFEFSWSDIRFEAEVTDTMAGPILQISAELAPIPYSAEHVERRNTLKSLCSHRVQLAFGHYFQSKRQWLGYTMKLELVSPITGAQVMETTAAALLKARIYFAVAKSPGIIEGLDR